MSVDTPSPTHLCRPGGRWTVFVVHAALTELIQILEIEDGC